RRLARDDLRLFVGQQGGAARLLHYGPRKTKAIKMALEFTTEQGERGYRARLERAADDSLFFVEEEVGSRGEGSEEWKWHGLGQGHSETRLKEGQPPELAREVYGLLRRLKFYHFHDTSLTSPLRTHAKADDDQELWSDGDNLAAFLLSLRESPDESD